MSKQVAFGENDLELIKKRGLPSFIEAVRILCKKGLQVNELISQSK